MSSGRNHECKACSSLSLATSGVKWQVRGLRCVEETDISLCGCFSPFEEQDRKSLRREADVEGFAATSMAH